MWFAIIAKDHPANLALRLQQRAPHRERLQQLQAEGRLLLAGPLSAGETAINADETGYAGSLIVADFTSLAAAQAWAEADPYVLAGVYAELMVHPFIQAFPAA